MRIESLANSPDRVGRYRLVLEDGAVLRLYRQTVEDFGLYPGMELTDGELEKLRVAAGEMSAKMRAVRIVSASSISKRDLEQRLIHKGENPEQAKAAVEWMADLSLVDDRKTAEQVVARCISKGYGIARAKQALYEKRIPKEYWDEVLAEYPEQTDKIVEFLESRLGENPGEKDVKRVIDALLRRGHPYGNIRRALAKFTEDSYDLPEV